MKYLVSVVALSIGIGLSGCPLMAQAAGSAAATARPDNAIRQEVSMTFLADGKLAGSNIKATVADGVVTLSGGARTQAAKTRAEVDAARVLGVKSVKNEITVQTVTAKAGGCATPGCM